MDRNEIAIGADHWRRLLRKPDTRVLSAAEKEQRLRDFIADSRAEQSEDGAEDVFSRSSARAQSAPAGRVTYHRASTSAGFSRAEIVATMSGRPLSEVMRRMGNAAQTTRWAHAGGYVVREA